MLRSLALLWCGLLTGVTQLAAQYQPEQSPSQQRPTDVNANLTEQFRQLEQEFADAILHKDAAALDRVVHVQNHRIHCALITGKSVFDIET